MTIRILHHGIGSDLLDKMELPSNVILEKADGIGDVIGKLRSSKYSMLIVDGPLTEQTPIQFRKIQNAVGESGQGDIIQSYYPYLHRDLPAYGALVLSRAKEV